MDNKDLKQRALYIRDWGKDFSIKMQEFIYDLEEGILEYNDEDCNKTLDIFNFLTVYLSEIDNLFEQARKGATVVNKPKPRKRLVKK